MTTQPALSLRRLADRYIIEAPLGAGGMGSIFRGRDERLGHVVAIKILKRHLVDDPVVRERFRREALSLSKLRHPGIVAVLDFGEAEGDLYTVLELVQGETLERRMHGPMEVSHAARIVARILAALEACHQNSIVHRDVKPSNVMVSHDESEEPSVTLIDFGLARIARIGGDSVDKLTETGAVHGTPHYMAPEQCRGDDVGPASDIYSTGVLFYEMLAGSEPFQGKDAATFMAQHLFVEPPPLRDVAPHVSAGLAAVVHSMLAKRPEDRPSAADLQRALASAVAGTDPEAAAEDRAARRHHRGRLARSDRHIGGGAPNEDRAPDGKVVVWMKSIERSAAIRGCLSVAGLECVARSSDEPPVIDRHDVVVVGAVGDIARMRAIDSEVPIIVVGISSPEQTTEGIRAGASDMLLKEAPDADLPAKVRRLLRRRARR